jgi:apolipoprotein N-acyltransferase
MEFPDEDKVPGDLRTLALANPDANLFVLSEYTFNGPVPKKINSWCKQAKKYLIVGAHDPAGDDYFNTAFVIGPSGEVVAKQAKSVPIQFFKDGLPARQQKPWESPWGKIGLGVCYDLSYRKVADGLARQQCQAFIIPTMDVAEWGARQHRLHARIAPMRAAELNVPIFRLCSSGISQSVQAGGAVSSTAPFPGEDAVLKGELALRTPARLPLDHWLGPIAVMATGIFMVFLIVQAVVRKKSRTAPSTNPI